MKEFAFDRSSQRYRVTSGPGKGQYISATAVLELTEKYIDQLKTDVSTVADKLVEGKITVATWEETTAKTLKELHLNSYALGKGGVAQMSSRDYGIIGSELRSEYEYLRGFSQDILKGELSEAQLRDRLSLYIDAAYSSYERGRFESHRSNGYNWERRYRNSAQSCSSCVVYAARGWQPLGSQPHIGEACECGNRCRCHKEYSKDRRRPKDSLLTQNWGYIGVSFDAFKSRLG